MADKVTGYDLYLIGDRELIPPISRTSIKFEPKITSTSWVDSNPKFSVPHREYENSARTHRFMAP